MKGPAMSEVNTILSVLTTWYNSLLILVCVPRRGIKDRPASQHSCLIFPCRTDAGRRLWENPFVKLTVFHGYRQPLSMGGFWVIICLTKRSVPPVFSGRFAEGFFFFFLTHRHTKHTHSHCFLSRHITHPPKYSVFACQGGTLLCTCNRPSCGLLR